MRSSMHVWQPRSGAPLSVPHSALDSPSLGSRLQIWLQASVSPPSSTDVFIAPRCDHMTTIPASAFIGMRTLGNNVYAPHYPVALIGYLPCSICSHWLSPVIRLLPLVVSCDPSAPIGCLVWSVGSHWMSLVIHRLPLVGLEVLGIIPLTGIGLAAHVYFFQMTLPIMSWMSSNGIAIFSWCVLAFVAVVWSRWFCGNLVT